MSRYDRPYYRRNRYNDAPQQRIQQRPQQMPESEKQQVIEWRDAAIADGWEHKPTFENEPESQACDLTKDGYKAMIMTRPYDRPGIPANLRGCDHYEVNIWGPDGLAIKPVFPYAMQDVIAGLMICANCKAIGPTVRIGFAGRCCPPCRIKLAPTVEYKGWCN